MSDKPAPDVPRQGRLAGIDYGTARIGIAICDPMQIVASPYENYSRGDDQTDRARFARLVEDEDIVGFVVGLPLHTDGQESQKSLEAKQFAKWLGELTSLPVAFQDERFSSKEASRHLLAAKLTKKQRKERLDMLAAQIILSHYLEGSRSEEFGDLS